MRPDELVAAVRKYDKSADADAIRRAWMFASKMHHDQQRETGEKYIIHPMAVAEILLEYKLDGTSITAALLHDTVEDTPASYESIKALFGKEVALLVEGLTKLEKFQLQSSDADQAENFQKLILASSKDIRILLIKFADRLHNMRTLNICAPDKRKRKAQETMDIYVPLAERLGLHQIKTELEDIAFRELNPTAYKNIRDKLNEMQAKHKIDVQRTIRQLSELLTKNKVKGCVIGRVKMPYSLWHKLQTHENRLSSIFDIQGFRIIVKTVADCYRVLGLVHGCYKAIPGRFKDYISTPKDSGYQSLQTSVVGKKGELLEIQIRTEEMEEDAQFGIAAHWSYKQGLKYDGKKLKWMQEFLQLIQTSKNSKEFLSKAKLHLYSDKLFCFDSDGKLYSLPQGATALDFACFQGSKVALRCSGVRVNGNSVQFNQVLKDGDKVNFSLSSKIVANKEWLKIVKTEQGQTLLNSYFNATEAESTTTMHWWQKLFSRSVENPSILGIAANKTYILDGICAPKMGDSIVGIEENGRVVIHKRTCGELKKYIAEPERWVSVEWNTSDKMKHTMLGELVITWKTGPESMGLVVNTLSRANAEIRELFTQKQEGKKTEVLAKISVKNKDHMLDVLDALRACPVVLSVYQNEQ